MGNYKRSLRKKLVGGSSIMRVFGSSYRFKEEAKEDRERRRRVQHKGKKIDPQITTERSIRAILTPLGGMNKKR